MQTGQHRHSHHGCEGQSRGPEVFYGYCHETSRMRMMDYTDYMNNLQTGYSNLYSNPASSMQPIVNALSRHDAQPGSSRRADITNIQDAIADATSTTADARAVIRCADVIEYARCGEVRRIPITFDNDTRRERRRHPATRKLRHRKRTGSRLAGIAFLYSVHAASLRRNHCFAVGHCGLQQAGRRPSTPGNDAPAHHRRWLQSGVCNASRGRLHYSSAGDRRRRFAGALRRASRWLRLLLQLIAI